MKKQFKSNTFLRNTKTPEVLLILHGYMPHGYGFVFSWGADYSGIYDTRWGAHEFWEYSPARQRKINAV